MSIYDIKVLDRKDNEVSLKEYEGKVLLIVNTATGCGFTPQYDELEGLYKEFNDKGFEILDFPCNQFGNQAPGTNDEIHEFCQARFNLTFKQFKKIDVNGENENELFKLLKENSKFEGFDPKNELSKVLDNILRSANPNYEKDNSIKWNFTKFLVDNKGNVIRRFEPTTEISEVKKEVIKLLKF